MTIDEITEAIIDGQFSEEELSNLNRIIVDEVKEARRRKDRKTVASLSPGDTVEVTGRLRGDAYFGQQGEVTKVNRTRVVVTFPNDPRSKYGITIPASVLTKVES